MKTFLLLAGLFLSGPLLAYLVGAFVTWSWDLTAWDPMARFVMAYLGVSIGAAVVVVLGSS